MISVTEFQLRLGACSDLGSWAANRIRGALGKSLRKLACIAQKPRCQGCPYRRLCAYGYCFEPEMESDGKFHARGQEAPRPYVLRGDPPSEAASVMYFELVLIGRAVELLPYFALAVKEWEQPGMGPGFRGTQLLSATVRHPFDGRTQLIYEDTSGWGTVPQWEVTPGQVIAAVEGFRSDRLTVEFVTPTRLRFRGKEVVSRPPFRALISSLLRRLEGLEHSHGLSTVVEDARALITLADQVGLETWEGTREHRERYSYRQHQRMEWQGIVGRATYRGDLAPFLPALRLGELVHVGKGAVFGLGRIKLGR